jgi:hypothetical protein
MGKGMSSVLAESGSELMDLRITVTARRSFLLKGPPTRIKL